MLSKWPSPWADGEDADWVDREEGASEGASVRSEASRDETEKSKNLCYLGYIYLGVGVALHGVRLRGPSQLLC